MNWTNIPSHIFENIFQNFSINELRLLSLVCKDWNEEIGDCWSERFNLKCCNFDSEENQKILSESRRQYRSLSICSSHINLGKQIISIIKSRNLRKPCKLLSITLNGVFYSANTPFVKVIDILNEYGGDLTTVRLSGLNDEFVDNLVLEKLPNVKNFELKGLLDLSPNSFENLYGGFENLKYLKLNVNRLNGFNKKFSVIQNLFLKHRESLEDISIELEVDNYSSDLYLESLKHMEQLTSLSITFSDRTHKSLEVDVLKHNRKLQKLRLKGCYITNEDILKIPKYFPDLRDIKLYLDTKVEETSLRVTGELPRLTTVELVFDGRFPENFENWFDHCNRNLKSLKLIGCRRFYDYFVSKTLQDRIDYAKGNPLSIENILKKFTKLEHLSVKLASVKLDNPDNLCFSNLRTAIFDDCHSQENTHEFFKKFKSPTLTVLKTDILGMTDETVDVVLSNFKKLKCLHLTSEDKLSIRAMQSLNKANLESISCYNLSIEMGMELLKNSNGLKFAELKFNMPQMDTSQRIKFEKEHKDIVLTAEAFDHKKAHQFLKEMCDLFTPPLVKSADQGWVVGSQCYRTYKLLRTDLQVDIAMKFNYFLN